MTIEEEKDFKKSIEHSKNYKSKFNTLAMFLNIKDEPKP